MPRTMWVYILASPTRALYVGVTNDLFRRWAEHQEAHPGAYTSKLNARRLVFVEEVPGQLEAIAREKQIKSWTRMRRLQLVESLNPDWRDLALGWGWSPGGARS